MKALVGPTFRIWNKKQANCIVYKSDPVVVRTVQLCCSSRQLSMSKLYDRTRQQMRRAVAQPLWPFEERPWEEKVLQIGCEVYIHCPLLNRLHLMKCLMLSLYQPNPRWQFVPQLPRNTTLWPYITNVFTVHWEVRGFNKPRQCVI